MSQAVAADREAGGPGTLEALFAAHYERVARIIGRVIHDQARAEEIAVEVFLKWSRTSGVPAEGAPGWLYRVAVREALDELRRLGRRRRLERMLAPFRGSPPTPDEQFAASSEREHVRAVLGALPPRAASLLLLWAEGLSYREIAAAAGVSTGYVGSLLSRAQEAFRKEYGRRYGN